MPFWRLFYHITWGTKNRLPLIDSGFEQALYKVIAAKGVELGARVHAVGGIENHVHLLASIPPKLVLSSFIGQVKGNSSHFVNNVIKPNFAFAWQSEFGIFTFDERSLKSLVDYVHNQREHHQSGTIVSQWELVD
jgi:REP element-mobilizing transposase RayT